MDVTISRNPHVPSTWDLYVDGSRTVVAESMTLVSETKWALEQNLPPITEAAELAAAIRHGRKE